MLPCLAFQLLVLTYGMHIYKLRVLKSTIAYVVLKFGIENRMKAELASFVMCYMEAKLLVETSGTTSMIAWDI